MHLELKALKEHEKLQTRQEKLRCEGKEIEIADMLRASEGLDVLIETGHVHRGRCARYWKGQNKDCHRCWQSKARAQPELKFASSKPSMTLSED